MARKITLTVPESLYYQIQNWRSSFNLSRVFQDAVAETIKRKEEFQTRLAQETNLNEIVQRLRREKHQYEKRTRLAAGDAGRKWAVHAHYADLITAVHATDKDVRQYPNLKDPINDAMNNLREEHAPAYDTDDDFQTAVAIGWRQGVCEFWSQVRDKL